jgi:SET domain-containing protein
VIDTGRLSFGHASESSGLYYAPSAIHGRGVFCTHPLHAGDIIEICPAIVLPHQEIDLLSQSLLFEYYFLWGEQNDQCAIALGYGSLYNHSPDPNAEFTPDFGDDTILFIALKDIAAGEEITVDYQAGASERSLWF